MNTSRAYYYPTLMNEDLLRLGVFNIHTNVIRCFSSAADIITGWRILESDGFPLDDICSTLSALEGFQYLHSKEFNVLPFPIHVVRLVDAISVCVNSNGFEKRRNETKEALCGLINDSRTLKIPKRHNGTNDFSPYWDYVNELLISILSSISEFRIARKLKDLDRSIEFTMEKSVKYPDLAFRNFSTYVVRPTLAEVKCRLNRTYTGEEIQKLLAEERSVKVSEGGLIALVSMDAFTKFEQAFDKQGGDVAIIDLTHSQYGDILAANSIRSSREFRLETAFTNANRILGQGQKAVLLYSEVFTPNPQENLGVAAIAIDRDEAEELGRRLDMIEKDHYANHGVHLNYYELIQTANNIA